MKSLAHDVVWHFALRLICGLVLFFAMTTCSHAATRAGLLVRLNELMDDASNIKMTSANKILFLDGVGREYGRRGLYIKRDTIITAANTELYTLNTDFAGGITGAYLKIGQQRTVLPVIDRDSAFRIPDVSPGEISYAFIESDGKLGLHAIPIEADTIILLYFAYPGALSEDTTEWTLPNHYEEAALYETASNCLFKIGTAQAQAQAATFKAVAESKLDALLNPTTQTRELGDTKR